MCINKTIRRYVAFQTDSDDRFQKRFVRLWSVLRKGRSSAFRFARYKSAWIVWWLFALYLPAAADTIVLKSGEKLESDRVWQTSGYVHFILKGTQNVELRYTRDMVDRIIVTPSRTSTSDPGRTGKETQLENLAADAEQSEPAPGKSSKTLEMNRISGSGQPEAPSSKPADDGIETKDSFLEAQRGLAFYDPNRAKPYWSDNGSGHYVLKEALSALSSRYGRSPEWVMEHMGDENDLALIHLNLMARLENEKRQGGKNPFGASKDNTRSSTAPSAGSGQTADAATPPGTSDKMVEGSELKDIQFYDPRRPAKYWTGPQAQQHHNTLNEAIYALANQFGVDARWIEQNMGGSNDLYEIHKNIRASLKRKGNQN